MRVFDTTLHLGEERVVAAHAHIHAGVHPGAALTHDDGARGDDLAAEAFDAEALRLRIAAVAGAAACFFVCHR